MNNFKITQAGYIYVSKDGNDANSGTKDLPKATPINNNLVIGSGVYRGVFNFNSTNTSRTIFGDGKVILESTAATTVKTTNSTFTANDIHYKLNSFEMSLGDSLSNAVFNRCIFEGGALNGRGFFTNCVLDTIDMDFGFIVTFNNCVLLGSDITFTQTTSTMTNTVVMDDTVITWASVASGKIVNCNFLGKIVVSLTEYELKRDSKGILIPDRIGNGIADIVSIVPDIYDTNFAENPLYLNLDRKDYQSVAWNSPNLFNGTTKHIGISTFSEVDLLDTVMSTTLTKVNNFYYTLTSEGELITNPIQLSPFPMLVGDSGANASTRFNSSFGKATESNSNVVAVNTYASGTAGANPRRITYSARWSTGDGSVFDNDGKVPEGDWVVFEGIPRIDNVGRGNGLPDFDLVNNTRIRATWIQFKIKLQEGL